jgi:hypothetical protein
MRKVSTLVGLTLFALAAPARAQEAAPAAATATPPAGVEAATPAPTQPTASRRRIQIGLSFLPMALGKYPAGPGAETPFVDAAFAYGAGLSAGYEVLHSVRHSLVVGIAPQVTFNVKPRDEGGEAGRQYDLMVRVAYAYTIVDTIALYAEVLPGYSIFTIPPGDSAKGPVFAFGVGAIMDLTDRVFANLGAGYEMGYQKSAATGVDVDAKTKYIRVALGGGVRF